MKLVRCGFAALALVSAVLGCDPYENPPDTCEGAQERLDASYDECDVETNIDFSCNAYSQGSLNDCSDYFRGVSDTARCEDGEVNFDYGGPCTA